VKQAYDVFPIETRADNDATPKRMRLDAVPLSTTIDFMDDMEGELNRRLAVLRCCIFSGHKPYTPEVSLLDVERRHGFPRDYWIHSWYLSKQRNITRADNSDFTLTADGVDFVECNA